MITIFDLRAKIEEDIVEQIKKNLKGEITVRSLEDNEITACIGCWTCWVKTPGKCCFNDVMTSFYKDYVNSEKVVLILDTEQGFINHTAKAFIDRTIPHYHPYIEIVNGECHHQARYNKYPELYFYFDSRNLTPEQEAVTEDYLYRTAYHFQSPAFRIHTRPEFNIKTLEHRVAKRGHVQLEAYSKPQKLVIYNGSPRLKQSNTETILSYVKSNVNADIEVRDLKEKHMWQEWSDAFKQEQHVIFAIPLYVHAMPSHVMEFIEKLEASQGGLGLIVQSGFPESSQSYYLEAIFEQIVERLGRKYMGTAIKGGIEGLQLRPNKSQIKMISPFADLISGIILNGVMQKESLVALAGKPYLSQGMKFLYNVLKPTGLTNFYWNMQLKENNAFEKRFDTPYGIS